MYFYHFTHRYGFDRVFELSGANAKEGDLVTFKGEYALCLGKYVSFTELYTKKERGEVIVVEKKLMGKKTMKHIHIFVNERFTTYRKIIPMVVGNDPAVVLKKKKNSKKKTGQGWKIDDTQLIRDTDLGDGQTLIVFPTVRSLFSMTTPQQREEVGVTILHGQSTPIQKANAFWSIRSGSTHTLLCTYSQIFQDWKSLTHILLIDQHARRYKNQQDPRWYVPTVLQTLSEGWKCAYTKTGYPALTII